MAETPFKSWALLELMGHRQVPGFVEDVELAGTRMLRVRVPSILRGEGGAVKLVPEQLVLEQYYSPAAVYALTPTTEQTVARMLAREAAYLPALPPPGSPPQAEEVVDDDGPADLDDPVGASTDDPDAPVL